MPKGFSGTGEVSLTPGIQYNIWEGRYYGGNNYFHHKTNIPYSSWAMFRIEAVGYSYGAGLAIRSIFCFHTSTGIYNTDLRDYYAGMKADSIYNSTDNYIVLVCYTPSYYSGWCLNAYTLNPTGIFNVQIQAVAQRINATPYY